MRRTSWNPVFRDSVFFFYPNPSFCLCSTTTNCGLKKKRGEERTDRSGRKSSPTKEGSRKKCSVNDEVPTRAKQEMKETRERLRWTKTD